MPNIELRLHAGKRDAADLTVTVQQKTYDYLMSSPASEIRVSAYLERDWPEVQANYAEIYVSENCPFESKILKVIPGSRVRKNIELPGPMEEGEQLTVELARKRTTPL